MGINQVNFFDDIKRGKIGEDIFKEDFLDFLNIQYKDVSDCQAFQIIDSDFLTKIGLYEIKANYNDNEMLIFEDYSNYNEEYGAKSDYRKVPFSLLEGYISIYKKN